MRLIAVMSVCLIAAICSGNAFAGTDGDIRCWTSNEDTYYHMQKDCNAKEKFPISEKSAIAFGKMACGICVEKDVPVPVNVQGDIWMAGRGGTYIMCIPAGMIDDAPEFEGDTVGESEAFTGDDAKARLRMMLNEEDFQAAQKRLESDGWVRDTSRIPELAESEKALTMNSRRIDNDWYMVIRPEKEFSKEANVRWRIGEWNYQLEDYGTLTLTNVTGPEYTSTIPVSDHTSAKAVYEKAFGDLNITVYREQGINTMVAHDARKAGTLSAQLFIGGHDIGISLNGYINSQKQQTYCCVLTDGELAGLVAGWVPELRYR